MEKNSYLHGETCFTLVFYYRLRMWADHGLRFSSTLSQGLGGGGKK